MCYCRLYDVGEASADSSPEAETAAEASGARGIPTLHLALASTRSKQREIFLFNDLLLVRCAFYRTTPLPRRPRPPAIESIASHAAHCLSVLVVFAIRPLLFLSKSFGAL